MPFPGFPLATGKGNSTTQFDDHPNHHNALAAAANDLQDQVDDHVGDATAAHAASAVSASSVGMTHSSGNDVQQILEDLDDAVGAGFVASVNGMSGVVTLDADDVPFTSAEGLAATDVAGALDELAASIDGGAP